MVVACTSSPPGSPDWACHLTPLGGLSSVAERHCEVGGEARGHGARSFVADAVLEDKIRHAHPIGTVELTCPSCTVPRQMNCYRFADGPFGTHKALHFVCPTLRRTLDRGQV